MASRHFYSRIWRIDGSSRKPVWKIVAVCFIALLFLVAIILAIVHIAKPKSRKTEIKKSMDDYDNAILKYFKLQDGIHIKWAHAVNSKKKLSEALNDTSIMFLEADVMMGFFNVGPIMAHPPVRMSDITLKNWLKQAVTLSTKGIKLDFKELRAVEPSLKILDSYASNGTLPPVLLNADVLVGPNKPTATPVNGTEFIRLCKQYFKHSTLSPGWTTRYANTANDGYTQDMVEEMYNLVKDVQQPVTFPVRASLVFKSKAQLLWLLKQRKDFTLTVWTSKDDIYDAIELEFLRKYPKRVYYDLPESQLKHLYDP